MYHRFLTRRVSQLLGLALVSWAFARIGVLRPSLRLPYLVFSIRSYLPLDFNHVSSLRPTYRHPFGRSFTYSLSSEFPGLELALISITDVVVSEADKSIIYDSENDDNDDDNDNGGDDDCEGNNVNNDNGQKESNWASRKKSYM